MRRYSSTAWIQLYALDAGAGAVYHSKGQAFLGPEEQITEEGGVEGRGEEAAPGA